MNTTSADPATYNTETPTDDNAFLAALRQAALGGNATKINGVMVDIFTASAIVGVYDRLNPTNRAKFIALPWPVIADTAFKILNRAKG